MRVSRLIIAASLLLASGAWAQEFPSRPLNMVIPFPPGGNTDLMARALQPELAKALGQPVVVINKGGAGGTIGKSRSRTPRGTATPSG
jgi:tripartite-type tricarboxylate transporter receptor subunit TctC